jgi:preprotein translocase SecE subunit
MAKTRAQRKAEKRRREAQLERERKAGGDGAQRDAESRAQHDTQAGVSGEVAEAEAVMETGARPEDYGEHTVEHRGDAPGEARSAVPGVMPEPVAPEQEPEPEPEPEAPAPSRADVGAPADLPEEPRETREERRARKKREKQERKQEHERALQRAQKAQQQEKTEKRRGGVLGFFASCWAELKKVQWPDRDTLVQASAVTIIFVAVMAAYLGALDGAFNWLIKQIL